MDNPNQIDDVEIIAVDENDTLVHRFSSVEESDQYQGPFDRILLRKIRYTNTGVDYGSFEVIRRNDGNSI